MKSRFWGKLPVALGSAVSAALANAKRIAVSDGSGSPLARCLTDSLATPVVPVRAKFRRGEAMRINKIAPLATVALLLGVLGAQAQRDPAAVINVAETIPPSNLDPQQSTIGADWQA